MGQVYIKNAYVVTMDGNGTVYKNGGVLVEDDKITAVGAVDPALVKPDAEVINGSGKYVLPGLVNTHVHTSQQLGRGLGDDVNLLSWVHERIWPYESNWTEADSYMSTLLCCLEQQSAGVTSFAEPGGQFVSGMARGVTEAGLRAKLAKSVMDCGEGLPAVWQHGAGCGPAGLDAAQPKRARGDVRRGGGWRLGRAGCRGEAGCDRLAIGGRNGGPASRPATPSAELGDGGGGAQQVA